MDVSQSSSLQVIAEIPATGAMTFGDTDHDGCNEVILSVNDAQTLSFLILEYQADGIYHQECVGAYMNPYATGDLDQDGKADVLGQVGNHLVLYEATSHSTYPDTLVWQSPALTNVEGFATIGDTDRDGKMEIIHSVNTFSSSRLLIYESTGDNAFVQRYSGPIEHQVDGPKVIADLDGDGLIEIAFCGDSGYVHTLESPSDDVWQQTFTDSTGLENAYAICGGVDTDRNGRPDLFVLGDDSVGRDITYVYEAVGDNAFAPVATLVADDGSTGGLHNVVANIQGTGRLEYVLEDAQHLRTFRAVAPGEWIPSSSTLDPSSGSHVPLAAFDVNQNGRDELFWACDGVSGPTCSTLVLEAPGTQPSSVDFPSLPALASLRVAPTPCRCTTLTLSPESQIRSAVSAIAAFDVAGRLVLRERVVPGTPSSFSLPASLLRPGLYLLRVEDRFGRPLATGRSLVLR